MRAPYKSELTIPKNAASWVGLAMVLVAYLGASEASVNTRETTALSQRFRFDQQGIECESVAPRSLITTREVHPSLQRIRAWVSATGAAVTLADLDQDGLFNDMLLVDARLNTLVVKTAPGTGDRFPAFVLDPPDTSFDPACVSPTGSLVGDFNEDGRQDILVHYWGRPPLLFLRSVADENDSGERLRAASFRAIELVNASEELPRWFSHAATQADVDGDGHLDLLIGNFFQDGADILNRDGTGEATVMHAGKSNARNGGGAKLFLWTEPNQRESVNAIFRDRSDAIDSLCGRGWVLALGAVDLDPANREHPGLPEIYIANDFGPDRLLHNRSTKGNPQFALCKGERGFLTPKSFVLGHDSYKGMGLDFGDINGDGLFDIYVSNIADNFALHEGHFIYVSNGEQHKFMKGIAPYTQQSSSLGLIGGGWGWDCRLVDLDNDGQLEAIQAAGFVKGTINRWPELHALGTTNDRLISNPRFWPRFQPPTADLSGHNANPFYVRSASGRFVNVNAQLGLDLPWNTRGLAIADVDGDGWQDIAAANQWQPSIFFRNQSKLMGASKQNSFVGLHLILPPPSSSSTDTLVSEGHPTGDGGRPAIGATASIELPTGQRMIAQVDGGSGHSGRRSPTIHFGLGVNAPQSVGVMLRWRDRVGELHEEKIRLDTGKWHTVQLAQKGTS